MTPEALADIHAACFPARPWRASELEAMMAQKGALCVALPEGSGFALAQSVLDEAELLTIAVRPEAQGKGHGRALMEALIAELAQGGVRWLHLEVDAENAPALALYRAFEFAETGRRKAYYTAPDGTARDALLMQRTITPAVPLPHGKAVRIG